MTTFYTGKGDAGSTTDFSCKERASKSSRLFEALGNLDELVSLFGLCRAKADADGKKILFTIQQDIFTIQAEIAGSEKRLSEEKTAWLEKEIMSIGATLPEIRTFLIPGENELGALYDLARTVARRAERELVRLREEDKDRVRLSVLAYMNRLSSLLYVLARREASKSAINEHSPGYGE